MVCELIMETLIYIIRHAESRGNTDGVFHGHSNGVVSEAGQEQLRLLERRFSDIHIDVIYSSPLLRTLQTAKAVRSGRDIEIIEMKELIEINGGKWEGMCWEEIIRVYPDEFRKWREQPWKFSPPGGETMTDIRERAVLAVGKIVGENEGKKVAVVTHSCFIRNFLCFAKRLPIEKLNTVDWCGNTGITVVRYENGEITSINENDISHLNE